MADVTSILSECKLENCFHRSAAALIGTECDLLMFKRKVRRKEAALDVVRATVVNRSV